MHLHNSPVVADWQSLPPHDLDALADVIRTCCRMAAETGLTSQDSPVRELARLHVTYSGHQSSSRDVCQRVVPVLLTAQKECDFLQKLSFDRLLSNALKRQAVNEATFLINYGDDSSRVVICSFSFDSIANGRLESISLLLHAGGHNISPDLVWAMTELMMEGWKSYCLYGYVQNPRTSPTQVFQCLKSHPAVFSPDPHMLKRHINCLLSHDSNRSGFISHVAARHQSSVRCSCHEARTPNSPADLHSDFSSCSCHVAGTHQTPDSCSCHVDESPEDLDGAFSGVEVLLGELKQHGDVVLGEAFIEACVAHHWRAMLLLLSWGVSVNIVARKKTALGHMIDAVLSDRDGRPRMKYIQESEGTDPALTPGIIQLLLCVGADTSFVNLDAYSCTHQSAAQYIGSCCPQHQDVPPSLSHLLDVTSLKETSLRAVIGRLVTVGLVHQPRGLCRLIRSLHTSGFPHGVRQLVTDRLLYIMGPNM